MRLYQQPNRQIKKEVISLKMKGLCSALLLWLISGTSAQQLITNPPSNNAVITACAGVTEIRLICTHNAVTGRTVWIFSEPLNCSISVDHDSGSVTTNTCPFTARDLTLRTAPQLNSTVVFTANATMNGTVIQCFDDRDLPNITPNQIGENVTLKVIEPPLPPSVNIAFTSTPDQPAFDITWTSVEFAGGYRVNSSGSGCGICDSNITTTATSRSCPGWTPTGQLCTFTVQSISDELDTCVGVGSQPKSILLQVNPVVGLSAKQICSRPLVNRTVLVTWDYTPVSEMNQCSDVTCPIRDGFTLNYNDTQQVMRNITSMSRNESIDIQEDGIIQLTLTTMNEAGIMNGSTFVNVMTINIDNSTVTRTPEAPCVNVSISHDCLESYTEFTARLTYSEGECSLTNGGDQESREMRLSSNYSACLPIVSRTVCYDVEIRHNGIVVGTSPNQTLAAQSCNIPSTGSATPSRTGTILHGETVSFSCPALFEVAGNKEAVCNNGNLVPGVPTGCKLAIWFIVLIVIIIIILLSSPIIGYLIWRFVCTKKCPSACQPVSCCDCVDESCPNCCQYIVCVPQCCCGNRESNNDEMKLKDRDHGDSGEHGDGSSAPVVDQKLYAAPDSIEHDTAPSGEMYALVEKKKTVQHEEAVSGDLYAVTDKKPKKPNQKSEEELAQMYSVPDKSKKNEGLVYADLAVHTSKPPQGQVPSGEIRGQNPEVQYSSITGL